VFIDSDDNYAQQPENIRIITWNSYLSSMFLIIYDYIMYTSKIVIGRSCEDRDTKLRDMDLEMQKHKDDFRKMLDRKDA